MAIYDGNGNSIEIGNSPLSGKTVVWIGDSNVQYNIDSIRERLVALGAKNVISYAVAGYAWENQDGNDNTVTNNSGVGQVNKLINTYGGEARILDENFIIIFMMGTNAYGSVGTFTNNDVSTIRGAVDYCLKAVAYYGRACEVGVILPWCGHDNDALKERAQYYGFPVIDLETEVRIIADSKTSYYAEHAYLGTDGNHFGGNGKKHFLRVIGNWIAYRL